MPKLALLWLLTSLAASVAWGIDTIQPRTDTNGITWGAESNFLRGGVLVSTTQQGNPRTQNLVLFISTSRTNASWDYAAAPLPYAVIRLTDGGGRRIPASDRKWEKLQHPLVVTPDYVTSKQPWTRLFSQPRSAPVPNFLPLETGQPITIGNLNLQSLFPIPTNAVCSLTVQPLVYQFAADRRSLALMPLPPVTIQVSLFHKPPLE